MDLLKALEKNPFVLAPMAGITDRAFRSFMRELGCSIVITELVSATGLKFNSQRTQRLMGFDEIQRPIGVQIFGESLEDLRFAAKEVEAIGADFVDLNFGCPVPKVVKKGGGAAILKDLDRVSAVFNCVKSATSLPVTVKIRTGWDDNSMVAIEVARLAYEEGLTWVAIHGRTRAQAYSGQADWQYIAEVKAASKIPILGNGDLTSPRKSVDRLRESSCDGVMIGRGCLKNPWIFREALSLWNQRDCAETKDFTEVFGRLKFHLQANFDEKIQILQIKKLSAWYSAGFPNSSGFRKEVFRFKELPELEAFVDEYFASVAHQQQRDTSDEAFLMGGHG